MRCSANCSGHCIREEPCDHVSGKCSNGCQDGYTGSLCNNCKMLTFYLDDLAIYLSVLCFVLFFCTFSTRNYPSINWPLLTACRDGYYGRHCSYVCPFTCQTCRHTDGLCTCKTGWTGPRCTEGVFLFSHILLLCIFCSGKILRIKIYLVCFHVGEI